MKNEVINYILKGWPKTIRPATEQVPYPFNSPAITDMYCDFYYWDLYFINKGLLMSGLDEQAENNIKNMAYFVNKLGYVPNANHLLNRSQPPVFALAVYDLYKYRKDANVINNYIDAIIKDHDEFWMKQRMTPTGLNSFKDNSSDEVILNEYRGLACRVLTYSDDIEEQKVIGHDIIAIAESGLDFNMRFRTENSKIDAHKFSHLDLNCFLYSVELKMAEMLNIVNRIDEANKYLTLAKKRKQLVEQYCFDKKQGMYVDYNFVDNNHSHIVTAVSLYPHAFGLSRDKESALKVFKQLELDVGVSTAAYRGDDIYYQWDYPVMWGETSYIIYIALANVGLMDEANRVKEKYMKIVENQFAKTGELWEKYDARNGEIMDAEYKAPPFMGWTAFAYQFFASLK